MMVTLTMMTVWQIGEAELDKLMSYDDKCFVRSGSAWRREFICRWMKMPGGRALMAVNQHGDVVGYGCRNPDVFKAESHLIAPLYADSYDVARDLMHELTCDIVGQAMSITLV